MLWPCQTYTENRLLCRLTFVSACLPVTRGKEGRLIPCAAVAGYAVDITIPSMRVAVEADGPSHFSRTAHPALGLLQLGATAMKRRHLQQLGWVVVNVPYSDWDKQTDEQQRVGYLKQRIAEAKRDLAAVTGTAAAGKDKDSVSASGSV